MIDRGDEMRVRDERWSDRGEGEGRRGRGGEGETEGHREGKWRTKMK